MAKSTFNIKDFEEWQKRFEKSSGDYKPYIERGLNECHQHITNKLDRDAREPNYPAGGKYSSGDSHSAIHRDANVVWVGDVASVKVGFDYSKTFVPILLMYGTPKYKPVTELYDDVYGSKTRSECRKIQLAELEKWWKGFNQ